MSKWRWPLLAVVVVALYAAAAAWLAPHFVPINDLKHNVNYQAAIALPTRVAEGAYGEWMLLPALWALVALLAFVCLRFARAMDDRSKPWELLGAQGLVLLALLFVSVTVSGDAYAYVIYGRLYGIHDLNPYLLGAAVPDYHDAVLSRLLQFYGNPPPGDNYGPLWTLFAGVTARLEAGASLGLQVWTHRVAAAAAAVVAAGGVLWALRRYALGERLRRTAMFAFHPLVLYESAVGGHNDIIMVAAAIWAWAVVDDLPLVAGLLLGASIAIKYVSVLLLPFLALRAARKGAVNGVIFALIACALPLLFFKPFWSGATTLYSLIGHGGMFDMSPLWLVNMPFFVAGTANAPAFPGGFSLPLFGQPSWPRIFELIAIAIVIGVVCVAVWRFARTYRTGYVWRSVAALLMSLPIIHPWYVGWILPAAADDTRWATYAWWLGVLVFSRYALDAVAPSQAGPLFTPILVVLTIVFLVLPVVLAVRDRRLTSAESVVRNQEGRADTL